MYQTEDEIHDVELVLRQKGLITQRLPVDFGSVEETRTQMLMILAVTNCWA